MLDNPIVLAPASSNTRVGFWSGFKAPLQGLRILFRRRDLWLLASVPMLWATVLAGSGMALSVWLLPPVLHSALGNGDSWLAHAAIVVAVYSVTAAGVLLSIVLGLALAQPLSGPALEGIARAVEIELGAIERPIVPFWRQLARSAGGVALGLSVGLPILVLLLIITIIFPITAWLTTPLKLLVFGTMVTWDLLDYPFTVRGWSLRMRREWMTDHKAAVLGFGASLGVVLLIPCVHVLLLPVGAIGATLLYHRSQATPSDSP